MTFDIDANGIVSVSAEDLGTGKSQQVTITGGTALSQDEIDDMFEFIGGYIGYRVGILPNGDWSYFVEGD